MTHMPLIQVSEKLYLVGGLEHFLFFHSGENVIIPIDELIFLRGVGQPPTRSIDSIDYPYTNHI